MLRRQTFVPDPCVVRDARVLVTDVLGAEGFPEQVCFVAALLTSEVVTNAVLHARGDFELAVSVDGGRARVTVRDGSVQPPRPSGGSADATTGRGLNLVDAMASAWGAEPAGHGKVVWFELAAAS